MHHQRSFLSQPRFCGCALHRGAQDELKVLIDRKLAFDDILHGTEFHMGDMGQVPEFGQPCGEDVPIDMFKLCMIKTYLIHVRSTIYTTYIILFNVYLKYVIKIMFYEKNDMYVCIIQKLKNTI